MATQTLEFNAGTGLTISCNLFALESDAVVATATATEKTNDGNRYSVDFTDVPAGAYRLNGFVGVNPGFVNEIYDLLLVTDVYLPRSEISGTGAGDASQATLLAIKAKTDLITSQAVNQTVDPLNTLRITRGDSFSGSVTVTTDYTGYTATFTIRHRVTDAVLLSTSATIASSTSISVALTTTETAFALLTLADEFGPHPFDVQLVSGSTQNTERGIAIITRDETRA